MGNAAILWDNLIDRDTTLITATSSLGTTPVQQFLKDPHVLNRWFSPIAAFVQVDFGSAVNIDTIAMIGLTGLGANLDFFLSLSNPVTAAGDVYFSGVLPSSVFDSKYLGLVHLIPTIKTARYMTIGLDSNGNLGMGRLVVGTRNPFAVNFVPGWSMSYVRRSVSAEGAGGQTFVDPKRGYRVVEASFNFISEADRNAFVEDIEMAVVNNGHKDMLWIKDVSSTNLSRDCIWGYHDGESAISEPQITTPPTFNKTYRIRERL